MQPGASNTGGRKYGSGGRARECVGARSVQQGSHERGGPGARRGGGARRRR
jgi:hypothetical protein